VGFASTHLHQSLRYRFDKDLRSRLGCGRVIQGRRAAIGHRTTALIGRWTVPFAAAWVASATSAGAIETTLKCPTTLVYPSQTVPIHVRIENSDCISMNVRLSSMLTANGSQTLGSTAIAGPKVAALNLTVPAGTCTFPPVSGVYENDLQAAPAVPASFAGKVAGVVLVTEANDGTTIDTDTDACVVSVPEPTRGMQLCAGLLGLLILAQVEMQRARSRSEKRT